VSKSLLEVVGSAQSFMRMGEFGAAEARLAEALISDAQAPREPVVLNLLGTCRLSLGKAPAAEEAFRRLLRLAPDSAPAFANLGLALRMQNRGEEALAAFQQAAAQAPDEPQSYFQLFKQLQQLSRWEEAIEVLERGLTRCPASAQLAEALALALGRRGRGEEAEALFRRLAPNRFIAANLYAEWLQEQGRFVDAADMLAASLRLQPRQGEPYRRLVEMGHFDGSAESIRELLRDSAVDDAARMHLHYALGRLLDCGGDYAGAACQFDSANSIAYRAYSICQTFDAELSAREPRIAAALYNEEFLAHISALADRGVRPTFIVGMIRSGTTLLDQIVSAHPDVTATGEGSFWGAVGDAVHARWMQEAPSREEVGDLAARYLQSVGMADPSMPFTDKMPLNYRHLGLIHAVFPEARILHLRRDPFDTCLSIYTTFFGGGPNFVYSRFHIAAFYRSYLEFMSHWRCVLPADRLLELDYEDLVLDPEPEIRHVIAFLGLQWDDACLRPEANPSPISTPSRWQARQPIYRTSTGKRTRYAEFLPEFAEL
jgi:tetratricopeptide (TPR) repeat protein